MTYVLSINHTRIISSNKYLSLGLQLYLHRQVLVQSTVQESANINMYVWDKNEDVDEITQPKFYTNNCKIFNWMKKKNKYTLL